MKRFIILNLLFILAIHSMAQGIVKGRILDKQTNTPLQFVNVRIFLESDSTKLMGGGITDADGKFNISGLANGHYKMLLTIIGYKDITRLFTLTPQNQSVTYPAIYMGEDTKTLSEVKVTGQKSTMKLEVDRKSFDVSQLISNAGESASDVLENIPSVEVDNEGNISLRGNESVEVWINGKASGLTTDNRAQILQQMPAESIERIEVIDNPSAKYSAEGSAGIINIVLKKDRKAGYYGSVVAGGDTRGGAQTSVNFNYNSSKLDAYANVGYRHRKNSGHSDSEQEYFTSDQYQRYHTATDNQGNNLFSRAGLTWHATSKDDIGLNGMFMTGQSRDWSSTLYHYGALASPDNDTRQMFRRTTSKGDMRMYYLELNYRHNFSDKHFLDFTVSHNRWKSDNDNFYRDSTTYLSTSDPSEYDYQYRPMNVSNRSWEVKLDYENSISDVFKIQAGYDGRFSHENTPQESWIDSTSWDGENVVEEKAFYNRFIYDMDVHALYFTSQYKLGKFGIMAGLRGEYWRVNTKSYDWDQEHDPSLRESPFKKDFFQLFPSVFLSYEITKNDQLQLNYTRRLRRPWGGQLNSFRDTRDATTISFGNPELTPEYSNSFSLNYLKTWTEHSLLLSAYYRPTTDVIERISWTGQSDGMMYQTFENVARSTSSGVELTLKDNFFRILDLTTNVNAYYSKLNGFEYTVDGQTITGEGSHNFTWNARMMASLILPYDISLQVSGRYHSRELITQGYRKSNFRMDFGVRKNFFNKKLTLSINCRDLLNTRKWESFTSSDSFTRHQVNKRGGRKINFTLTWNFGNTKQKKTERQDQQMDVDPTEQYNGDMGN